MGELGNDKLIHRFELIAPLLNEGLDAFERRRLRARILESSGISERTLRRYVQAYKEKGYKSLTDIPRSDKGSPRTVPERAISEAVALRQELPTRSVGRIIEILEGEKIVKPGEVSRTSLNRHLIARGYGAAQLRAEGKAAMPSSRFERKRRNSLFQADYYDFLFIPIIYQAELKIPVIDCALLVKQLNNRNRGVRLTHIESLSFLHYPATRP